MTNQGYGSFGKELSGVLSIEKSIANVADTRHAAFKDGHAVKESFPVPALLSGMGTGKSIMLDRHVDILRKHCQDEQLQ